MIGIPIPTGFADDHALIVMSRRFEFRWAGALLNREGLTLKVSRLLLEGVLSDSDSALVALVRGCSRSDSRLEEYMGGALQKDVWEFFASKASWYQTLHQRELLSHGVDSHDIDAAVACCRANRAEALSAGLLYREFDGLNARIKEGFLPAEALQYQDPNRSSTQFRLEPRGFAIPIGTLTSLCSRVRRRARLLPTDVIIITYPGHIDIRTGEVSGFSCHFDDSVPPMPDTAKSYIQDFLVGNKLQEQDETAQPGYVKRYMNLSTYFGAEHKPQHQPIGFKRAMRWVIDFVFQGEWILGMLDIRVVRFDPSEITAAQLGEFAAICLSFQTDISRSIQHFAEQSDSSNILLP